MPFGDYIMPRFILAIEPPPTVGFSIKSDNLDSETLYGERLALNTTAASKGANTGDTRQHAAPNNTAEYLYSVDG